MLSISFTSFHQFLDRRSHDSGRTLAKNYEVICIVDDFRLETPCLVSPFTLSRKPRMRKSRNSGVMGTIVTLRART